MRDSCAMQIQVWLGLGANLGDRKESILRALAHLRAQVGTVSVVSELYETEAWGVTDQPPFLNAACDCTTTLGPLALLDQLKAIESQLGRAPGPRWGPRAIDLDILLYGTLRLETDRLVVPHAGMLRRASVLVPLADIAPDLCHPVTGLTISEHLRMLGPVSGIAPYPPGLSPLGGSITVSSRNQGFSGRLSVDKRDSLC